MTPAQRVALEEIRDGTVERFYPMRLGYRPTAPSRWTGIRMRSLTARQDTIDRCVAAGWARVEGEGTRSRRPLVLTDAGREALDA